MLSYGVRFREGLRLKNIVDRLCGVPTLPAHRGTSVSFLVLYVATLIRYK